MGNEFDISLGNLGVLQKIPEMMLRPNWREKLRLLVIDYVQSEDSAQLNSSYCKQIGKVEE